MVVESLSVRQILFVMTPVISSKLSYFHVVIIHRSVPSYLRRRQLIAGAATMRQHSMYQYVHAPPPVTGISSVVAAQV